jgi:hypothetical protein
MKGVSSKTAECPYCRKQISVIHLNRHQAKNVLRDRHRLAKVGWSIWSHGRRHNWLLLNFAMWWRGY